MEQEINLTKYFFILLKKWWFIVLSAVVFWGVAWGYCNRLPDIYRSQSVIFPIDNAGSFAGLSGMAAQLIGFGGSGGGSSAKKIEVVFKSRKFAVKIAKKMVETKKEYVELANLSEDDLVDKIKGMIKIVAEKSGSAMNIVAESSNSKLSFTVNKIALVELQIYLNELTLTKAKKNRIFVGRQLVDASRRFLENGKELSLYNSSGRTSPERPYRDVDLGKLFSASLPNSKDESPDFFTNSMDGLAPIKDVVVGDVPLQTHINYLMMEKQMLATLNALLAQKYEMARGEEDYEAVDFEIIDEPQESKAPYVLKKQILTAALTLMGGVFGVILVLLMDFYQQTRRKSAS